MLFILILIIIIMALTHVSRSFANNIFIIPRWIRYSLIYKKNLKRCYLLLTSTYLFHIKTESIHCTSALQPFYSRVQHTPVEEYPVIESRICQNSADSNVAAPWQTPLARYVSFSRKAWTHYPAKNIKRNNLFIIV